MSDHYFANQPDVPSHPRVVRFDIGGRAFALMTDAGVFSKSGLDFGTRVLLETVQVVPPDGRFVDLGCGYGPVGVVLGTLYPASAWTMVDVNARAVELARANVERHGVAAQVVQADGVKGLGLREVDGVFLNPPIRAGKTVVYRLFAESAEVLREGGALWVVIHKKHGAASAQRELELRFRSVELADRKSGYHVFRCRA